jgi:hypothetical protein
MPGQLGRVGEGIRAGAFGAAEGRLKRKTDRQDRLIGRWGRVGRSVAWRFCP